MEDFWKSFGDARDKARKNHYKCLYPGCGRNAINSHLVQQHPFLDSIAENGNLYQIKDNEINPQSGDFSDSKEQLLSIRQVLSMPLFCSQHDNDLFKPIESVSPDLNSIETCLLFSLRGLASQRYLESKRLVFYQTTGYDGDLFDEQRDYSEFIIKRFDRTLSLLLNDIQKQSFEDYVFEVVDLPYVPVCGSDAFVDDDGMAWSYYNGNKEVKPIDTLYMTLLPFAEEKKLKLVIGYHKRYVVKKQILFFEQVLKKKNANMLLQTIFRMKNWCCSPSLFEGTDFATIYEIKRAEIILG